MDICGSEPCIMEYSERIRFEEFYQHDVDKPPFSKDDKAYIDELDIVTRILNVVRSVEGYYIYECDYTLRTEENPDGKLKAEQELELEKQEYFRLLEKYNHKNDKKWYQFWK